MFFNRFVAFSFTYSVCGRRGEFRYTEFRSDQTSGLCQVCVQFYFISSILKSKASFSVDSEFIAKELRFYSRFT